MKYTCLLLITLGTFVCSAQQTIEAGLGPLFNYHFIRTDPHQLGDSMKNIAALRTTFQGGIRVNLKAGRNWKFQTGIGYARNSSRFERTGLEFHDTIHTEIGRIEDLSQAATKTVIYKYNFDYIEIPLNFMYQIHVQKGTSFYTPYVLIGVQNQLLMKHFMHVDLKGFSAYGEQSFDIDKTGWDGAEYKMQLNLGARFEFKMEKSMAVSVQPEIKIPLMATAGDNPSVNHGALGLWLGINRKF
jgi:hypothetical protein